MIQGIPITALFCPKILPLCLVINTTDFNALGSRVRFLVSFFAYQLTFYMQNCVFCFYKQRDTEHHKLSFLQIREVKVFFMLLHIFVYIQTLLQAVMSARMLFVFKHETDLNQVLGVVR